MADNLTTATIDVRANTRGMERDILKALQTVELSQINTKKSSQALGRITGQVSEFNKSLEASNARVVAFGASAGAIFAVEKALSSLISSTVNVQKQLADVNVLLNLSSSSLEKFGSSLFDIARNTAQSFSEVATAATELSRQGLGVEETLKRTNAALILTRLSGLDAKSSVEALTATLNSFSGSALDAVEVVNKLANVDAAFAVSSADLANAISRVGSTAVDAGVSLDELIALVTSAQQTTARGGAVIGNSFKTIFTRLQRGKVQDLLGSLGVDTGEGQSAISLLQQLASTYDTLGASQKSYVAEQVGGVFQINILKAALSDLGKEYSIYGRALDTSLSSTDEAIRRNELLNKTVSALSSQTVASLEQAANKIGSIVFEPNAKGFLSGFNNLLESFNNIDAESAGGKLMTGFFKGIGDFIGGPGAVLATAVLVKLFARLTQFAAGSAKELLGTNKAAQQQQAIEQSILSILQKNSQFTSQILAGKMTTVQAEKQMLDYLTAQSNILREQERLSKVIGANLAMKGVSVGASGIPMTAPAKKTKAAASGYIPNFATDMAVGQAMENAGAREHGYRAGKAKKTTIHDGNGKSFKSFVNNKEDVKTFTNAAGKKATIVRPPNGFGENTQYAAGGYVPNFVKNQTSIRAGVDFEKRLNKSLKGTASFSPNAPMDFPLPEGYGADNKIKSALGISGSSIYGDAKISRSRKSEQSLLDKYLRTTEGQADFLSSKETKKGFVNLNPKGLSMLFSQSGADARGVAYISTLNKSLSAGAQNLIKTKFGKSKKSRTLAMPYIADKINTNALSALSSGYVPNFASMGSKFKAMYGGGTTMRAVDKEKAAKKKNLDVKKLDLSDRYTMVHGGNQGLDSANVSLEAGNKLFDAKIATAGLDTAGTNLQRYGIKGVVGDALVGATNNIIKTFGGKEQITDASSLDNAGSVGSAAGTVFETALRKAFNAPAVSQTQRIDFPAPTPELKKFFHNAPGQYEAKISRTPDNLKSTLKKWVDVNGLASSASGYIPNFAKSGLSYSYKDKDEFGFSEIQAIIGGKKVGSFSYAEDKKGLVDVGDFSVNKGERGKGIGTGLYKEAIRRNKGKKMKGQLLPQMNRLLQKIKNGEPVSAETLYPQIKRADLAKSSMFEVYGHKGMTVEKMTRDQFSSFVNAKINELKKDPKKLQSFFGNVEADEYGGLGVDLQTQHASGFVPNFLEVKKDGLPFGVRGRANFSKPGSKPNIQLGVGATPDTLFHEASHLAYSKATMSKANSNEGIGRFISDPKKYAGVQSIMASSIFKNVNQNELFKSLGLNPVQLDFDGKNPGATYSGAKAIDEITTRIQEKIFKNKGDLASLSENENAFIKNVEGLGIISNKRMSNVSRRSAEGSKFRSLIEGRFSSAMGGAYSGYVPNFSNALNDAIAREQSSGLSKSQIYVDKHSSLKNKNNPMGLMVANTRDEPSSGIQGINRAKKEGRNPKTYGGGMSSGFVPNFGLFGPSQEDLDAVNEIDKALKQVANEIKKSAKAFSESDVKKNIEDAKKEKAMLAKQSAKGFSTPEGVKKKDEAKKAIKSGEEQLKIAESKIFASENLIKNQQSAGKSVTPQMLKDLQDAKFEKSTANLNIQSNKNKISAVEKVEKELAKKINERIKNLDDEIDAGNGAVKAYKMEQSGLKQQQSQLVDKKQIKQNEMGALGRTKKFVGGNAMTLGFGLQSVASIAGEFAGNDNTQAGRTTKAVSGGIGDIASFAGTGAMIAGPWGAAAGALVGLGKAAIDVTKAFNTKVPDMEMALQNSSDSMSRFGESGQKLLTLNEQYGDALTSGNPTQAADLMAKTQQAYAEELNKLTEAQRSSMISAIAQGKGQEEYAKILGEMQNSVKAQENATQLTKFSESGGLFSGPDKKLLTGLDKGLALDFTKGMDIGAITAALEKSAPSLGNANLGTENQALDLMKSLAGSASLSGDQKENLNKMIEAFASAAETTDLSDVAKAFIKNIKEKPKSDADVKKLQEAAKAEFEARAAKAKKEIEIREKTNAMLIKLQSDTEAVYQRYNNSIEDFISSVETASQMMEAAGQFRVEYLSEAGLNKDITDPIKEKNIVNKNKADLKVGVYKSQLETSKSFKDGVDSLLSGIEADTAKAGVGQSSGDQAGELSKIKLAITKALLPVQEMITGGDYEGAKSKTQEVFNQLKPEERTAIGEDKISTAVKQLESGIDQGARNQDLLVKNSQKDLAIQAQQLIFQKATSKLAQAQNFGGSASALLDPAGDQGGAFDTAMKALGNLRATGYNQESLKQGKDQQVAGGDRNTFGLNGQKPSKGAASDVLKFYQSMSEFSGESVMSTESKDFGVIVQALKEELSRRKQALEGAGAGVVDPAVFERINSTLATLGGDDQVAKLKAIKATGAANISGKNIVDEAMKGYTGGAFANLSPELKAGFEATTDEAAGATFLLLADQKSQTASILTGQTTQTDSLNGALGVLNQTGIGTNGILAQQPSQIAQAIGAILEKGRVETEKSAVDQKVEDINREIGSAESKTGVAGQIQENKNIANQANQRARDLNPGLLPLDELERLDEQTVAKYREQAKIGQNPNVQKSRFTTDQNREDYKFAQDLVTAFDNLDEIKQNYSVASGKETENKALQTKKAELEKKKSTLVTQQSEKGKSLETANLAVVAATAAANAPAAITTNDKTRANTSAANFGMTGGDLLTDQQRKARARSQGEGLNPTELTYDKSAGQTNTFEVAAMNQFGGANEESYKSIIQQGAVPSFEKFGKEYERLGGKGKGKEFYQKQRNEMFGLEPTAPTAAAIPAAVTPAAVTPAAVTPAVVAAASVPSKTVTAPGFKNANAGKTGSLGGPTKDLTTSRLGPSENSPQWFQDSYNRKPGSLGGPTKDLRTSRLAPSANSPQWMQDSLNGKSSVASSDLRAPRLTAGAEKTTQQVVAEKLIKPQIAQEQNNKVKPDQRQDPTQVVSNILTTVNQIAAELQKQVSPTAADGGQSVASGGSGSVSVSAPVNLSINSTAGENKTEVANVADKIKTDLTAFLSSPEFLERVTTIAKNATGNPQPPKQTA